MHMHTHTYTYMHTHTQKYTYFVSGEAFYTISPSSPRLDVDTLNDQLQAKGNHARNTQLYAVYSPITRLEDRQVSPPFRSKLEPSLSAQTTDLWLTALNVV